MSGVEIFGIKMCEGFVLTKTSRGIRLELLYTLTITQRKKSFKVCVFFKNTKEEIITTIRSQGSDK